MLSLVNFTKLFPGQLVPTLDSINLDIMRGEFCVVVGNNGSGKSTLMRCIAGEYGLDSGSISINQQDMTKQDRSSFIASVTQDINIGTVSAMTLLENMVLSQMRSRQAHLCFYKRQRRAEIVAIIKEFNLGLEDYIDQPMSNLSGGQRQIIATIMAITSNPQILLLDEHTSALDPNTQNLLMAYTVESIAKNKITAIMITHKLETALRYGNRLIVLNKGGVALDVKNKAKDLLEIEQLLGFFQQRGNVYEQ